MPKKASNGIDYLNIGHLNIYHLANKIHDLSVFIENPEPFHFLGLTETRLKNHITDETINIPNYTIYRRDSSDQGQVGIAAFVHRSVDHLTKRRSDLEKHIECLVLEFSSGQHNRPLFIVYVYKNPSENNHDFQEKFQDFSDLLGLPHTDTLLLGDFNIDLNKPHHSWDCTLNLLGLQQFIKEPTRITYNTSTIIDHIYSNCPDHVSEAKVPNLSISDHFPIKCKWKLKTRVSKKKEHTTIRYRCFKNFDETLFLQDLSQINFDNVLQQSDPEKALDIWYALFSSVLGKHAPIRTKRVKRKTQPPWLNAEIIKAMKVRDSLKKQKKI